MTLRNMLGALALGAVLAPMLAFTAMADTASGNDIQRDIIGNTVQGSMVDSGAYAEFYQEDGTIVGKDYTGVWTIEGDQMCFQYGDDPASCWMAEINGDAVNWIQDGAVLGTGTILPGNQLPQ